MTYDRLVCANCAAPVSEGRCPVCRASRERLKETRGQSPFSQLSPPVLLALLVACVAAVVVLAGRFA
ncbi:MULTISPECIES: hypothetical protein [Streptomyces]|uniref:DUF2116 family Zn-ribbon domain-containing protein n=1 Tax=Streptomyces evansiae TaxID=3075535 RepID=A0ABU2R131_9ACTN|nr:MULTISPECIES: hypothetical protein [unclassified Streptomyces]EFL02186.1 predicted protein [Streptomyces sp. SPB78]MDT0410335.1 hypothetical protein [Streptomyces sp. DSM 41979]MDT0423826.1 hypothetical protein [Streptomyces sp. DSM 41859]MYQ61191.1 hypothetical protein [Streptomyces sp. SID4926]WEH29412.1 hypothetical protein P0D76_19960 [Streptomyces sp. AM 3-1-1]